MRTLFRSTTMRMAAAALSSALFALFVLVVNPFPTDVYGQAPGTGQPATGQTQVSPGTVTRPTTTVQTTTTQPQPARVGQPTIVTQQPAALPRTGTGLSADAGLSTSMAAYMLLALAAGLGSAAVVVQLRRLSR